MSDPTLPPELRPETDSVPDADPPDVDAAQAERAWDETPDVGEGVTPQEAEAGDAAAS